MGVDGLSSFLKSKSPNFKTSKPLTHFSGQRIAIDGHNWMYRHFSVAQSRVIDSTTGDIDRREIIKLWHETALQFNLQLISANILPVWIFDGTHAKEKSKTQAERAKVKTTNLQRIAELQKEKDTLHPLQVSGDAELRNLMKRVLQISNSEVSEFKTLLTNLGLPVIRAEAEGEKLGALLCRAGKVIAVHANDTDLMAYQCPIILTNISRGYCDVICLHQVLTDLNISANQLTELCVLLGCDYNDRIPSLGPVRAFKYISKYTLAQLTPETIIDILPSKAKTSTDAIQTEITNLKVPYCLQEFTTGEIPTEINLEMGEIGESPAHWVKAVGKLQLGPEIVMF